MLITLDEVQIWLEATKLRLASDDELVEEPPTSTYVLARLSGAYDTSTWSDASSTPALVRQIISMLVAARRYNKTYSEASDAGNPYADKLEQQAMTMLEQIVDGTLALEEITTEGPSVSGTLSFYPTDSSTLIDDEDDAGRAFSMGARF